MRSVSIFLMLLLWGNICHATDLPKGAVVDSILVVKNQRKMYVFRKGVILKTYTIALGRQPVGPKQSKGDNKTPEGLYFINGKNAYSSCHKNLGISYPNNKDRIRAKKLGLPTGGDVKIHGLPNGQGFIGAAHTAYDWTYGCIAVTDEEIDELFNKVAVGTPINILP